MAPTWSAPIGTCSGSRCSTCCAMPSRRWSSPPPGGRRPDPPPDRPGRRPRRAEVEDNGPGLPAKVHDRLFKHFVTGRPGAPAWASPCAATRTVAMDGTIAYPTPRGAAGGRFRLESAAGHPSRRRRRGGFGRAAWGLTRLKTRGLPLARFEGDLNGKRSLVPAARASVDGVKTKPPAGNLRPTTPIFPPLFSQAPRICSGRIRRWSRPAPARWPRSSPPPKAEVCARLAALAYPLQRLCRKCARAISPLFAKVRIRTARSADRKASYRFAGFTPPTGAFDPGKRSRRRGRPPSAVGVHGPGERLPLRFTFEVLETSPCGALPAPAHAPEATDSLRHPL